MAKKDSTPDWEAQFLVFRQNVFPEMIELLAEQFGVSVEVINRLEVGWYPGEQAWVTREFDDKGNIVGLQKRYRDGKKFMVLGSKRGLVYERVGQIKKGQNNSGTLKFVPCRTIGLDCPLCGKRKWCMVTDDSPPSAVICGHTSEGAIKYIENSGYLHHLLENKMSLRQQAVLPHSDFPILVVEGFSDVAAAMHMGRVGVGKPNDLGGSTYLSKLLKGKDVITLGENDIATRPNGEIYSPGKLGMVKIFNTLRPVAKTVKKVLPPPEFKDLRKWLPTADVFDAWIKNESEQADNSQMIDVVDFNLLADRWRASFKSPLIYFFEDWYRFDNVCYRLMQRGWLQAQVREFFRNYEVVTWTGKNQIVKPLQVNTYFVTEIEAALKCACRVDMQIRTDKPFWIGIK